MDDLVKIYDTKRGTSWVEGKGYGTVSGTRSGKNKKGSTGNNWSSILTSLKRLGNSNSSDKTQSSPNNTAHNYYMPFSVIPVETSAAYQPHQHQKYRSLSVATGNPYLHQSSPHLHHPPPSFQNNHHRHGVIDYSIHQTEFNQMQPFRSRTTRSPKSSKRSSLFDSTWEPLSHHPHIRSHHQLHHPHQHDHESCTCSQAATPIHSGVSNRYPIDQSAIYFEGGSEKMRSVVSMSRRSTSTNCTESKINLCDSRKLINPQYSVRTTFPDHPSSTVSGNKLTRSAYTTLGGGFMRALRKNSKEPLNPPSRPVTAYDLIEQQFGRQIEDDDDLSDNIIESSQDFGSLPGNKKKQMIKRGTESVSQSYSRLNHSNRSEKMSAREAEDLLASKINMRIGGQGVAFSSWNQTMPKSKTKKSPNIDGKIDVRSQMKQKNELNEVEFVEDYSVPEPDYDDENDSDNESNKKKQLQYYRHDDYREVECDQISPSLFHQHPDQVAIHNETLASSSLNQKGDVTSEYSSKGANLVNSTTSSDEQQIKSVKKSILKKFTPNPLKSQLDSSEPNSGSDASNCLEQNGYIEDDVRGHETNDNVGIETSLQDSSVPLHNSTPRKVTTAIPSRTNMMSKLKRKTRKHVTFRSLSEDSMMLEQINEPIMEEEEPIYDDVECGADNEDNFSMDQSNLGTRRMSSQSSNTTTTTLKSSCDEANDQNNHHLHKNSPSIGSTSGNVRNSDDLHSRFSKKDLSLNKNEKSKKDSQIKYSRDSSSLNSRNKSFVANHHETIISDTITGAAAISNGSNERILIDPSYSSSLTRRKGKDMEKNASIIYKASSHSDPVDYDSNTNPNKDIYSRDTRLPHHYSSNHKTSPLNSSTSHVREDILQHEKDYDSKLSQNLNEDIRNLNPVHDEVYEADSSDGLDEEEDKYEAHKSKFTVSVVNRIDRSLCSDPSPFVGKGRRVGEKGESSGGNVKNELKCECNKIVIDVSSGNVYETIQGQDQEHIYEEVGLLTRGEQDEGEEEGNKEPEGKKSIFDGASKDEILEYLEDAKERVEVLISNCEDGSGSTISHREVMMSPEMRVIEVEEHDDQQKEDDGVIDAVTVQGEGEEGSKKKRVFSSSLLSKSRSSEVAVSAENLIESTITSSSRRNRTSNVSNSSTDSAVTTSSSLEDESSLRSGPLITSSVSLTQLVERNDSGVGTETSSRPTRLRRSSSAIVGESEQRCTDCEQVFESVQYDEPSSSGGYTSFFPLTCNKCDKKRSERREIISEFVETEFKYGRDLRIIREEFYRPVEVAGLLSKEQIKSIFLNLDELINVNSRFSEKLQDALDIATEQGDEEYTTVNLGRLFMDSSSLLLAFETYCSQQGSASLILAHLEKEKELLRIFLRVSQMENTLLRRMNLSAFLMVPVQRVTKYPLLLNRLYKVTPYHHRDREALKAAQQKVELHLEHINQQTKTAPNKIWRRISNLSVANRRLPAVLEDIGNMKLRKAALDALKWAREDASFVLCGKLLFAPVTESSSSSSTTKKGRTIKFLPIHALLVAFGTPTEHYRPDLAETDDPMKTFSSGRTGITDAALVVVKEKSSRYTLCHEPLHLSSCIIRMESEEDDVFEVHEMNKDSFMFKAESSDIAKQWFKHIGYHSRDLGGWRRRRNALANIMMVK